MTSSSARDGKALLHSGLGMNSSQRSHHLPVPVNHGLLSYLIKLKNVEITLKVWKRLSYICIYFFHESIIVSQKQ
jgi:hypothetical protein